jgi:hypothetical protein
MDAVSFCQLHSWIDRFCEQGQHRLFVYGFQPHLAFVVAPNALLQLRTLKVAHILLGYDDLFNSKML